MPVDLFRLISSLKVDQKEGSEAGKQTGGNASNEHAVGGILWSQGCGPGAVPYIAEVLWGQVGMSVRAAPVSAHPWLALIAYG